ncbi:MAG: hypothetical protein QW587_00425 [Candidatus Bathyarchaeia archaeon]
MAVMRDVLYFERPGSQNTLPVIEAVNERLRFGDIRTVVVPVTTGKTAELFSRELRGEAEVVTVSEDEAAAATKRIASPERGLLGSLTRSRLEEASRLADKRLRREAFDMTFLPFSGETWNAVRETLYAFGQGMKVAIEVSVVAVELMKVKPYSRVIAVGGTEGGTDTAIVVRTSPQNEAFGKETKKRLAVQEIIAIPIEKW